MRVFIKAEGYAGLTLDIRPPSPGAPAVMPLPGGAALLFYPDGRQEVIESKDRNGFQACPCGRVWIEGGYDYLRRGGKAL